MSVTIKVQSDLAPLKRFREIVLTGLNSPSMSGPFGDMRKQWGAFYGGFIRKRFDANSTGGGDGSWPPLALSTVRRRPAAQDPTKAVGNTLAAQARKQAKAGGQSPDAVKAAGKQARAAFKEGLKHEGSTSRAMVSNLRMGGNLITGEGARMSLARDTKRGGILVSAEGRTLSILVNTGVLKNALAFSQGTLGSRGNLFQPITAGIRYGFAQGVPHPGKGKSSPTIAQIAGWHNAGAPPHLPQRLILAPPDANCMNQLNMALARAVQRAMKQAEGG